MFVVEPIWHKLNQTDCAMNKKLTAYDSSVKVSTNMPSNSSALSILLAYSPMIQIKDALASGSSNSSRLAHNVGMTPS